MMDSITFKPLSDVGLVRENNEDSFIARLIWDDHHLLCAAIDGVGGYQGGEVAAEVARTTITDFLNDYPDDNIKDVIAQAVLQANNTIFHLREKGPFPRMSCVVSAAIIDTLQDKVYIAHVGDSRIYLYHNGTLTKLTHDHSLVGYREEIGELTEKEAMNHPMRNVIERCLGDSERVFGEGNFIESSVFDIPANGKLLFCSDGLTDLVTSAEICQILASDNDTGSKCQLLVDRAKEHGGKDNVTVVLVETHTNAISGEAVTISINNNAESPESSAPSGKTSPRWLLPLLTLVIGFFLGFLIGNGNGGPKNESTVPVTDSLRTDSLVRDSIQTDSLARDSLLRTAPELNDE